MVLMESHSSDQPKPRQHMHDAIDRRLWHCQNHAPALTEQMGARGRGPTLCAVVKMLEDGQHGDHVESLRRAKVVGEATAHQANRSIHAIAW